VRRTETESERESKMFVRVRRGGVEESNRERGKGKREEEIEKGGDGMKLWGPGVFLNPFI